MHCTWVEGLHENKREVGALFDMAFLFGIKVPLTFLFFFQNEILFLFPIIFFKCKRRTNFEKKDKRINELFSG